MTSIVGTRLRTIRRQRKLTQAKVAEALGYAPEYVSRVETGSLSPSWRFLVGFANFLGMPVARLLHEAGLVERPEVNENEIATMIAAYPRLAAAFEYTRSNNDPGILVEIDRFAGMVIRARREDEREAEQGGGATEETGEGDH